MTKTLINRLNSRFRPFLLIALFKLILKLCFLLTTLFQVSAVILIVMFNKERLPLECRPQCCLLKWLSNLPIWIWSSNFRLRGPRLNRLSMFQFLYLFKYKLPLTLVLSELRWSIRSLWKSRFSIVIMKAFLTLLLKHDCWYLTATNYQVIPWITRVSVVGVSEGRGDRICGSGAGRLKY